MLSEEEHVTLDVEGPRVKIDTCGHHGWVLYYEDFEDSGVLVGRGHKSK